MLEVELVKRGGEASQTSEDSAGVLGNEIRESGIQTAQPATLPKGICACSIPRVEVFT